MKSSEEMSWDHLRPILDDQMPILEVGESFVKRLEIRGAMVN